MKCGQEDVGQTGEYPCPECGLPLVWDDKERNDGEFNKRIIAYELYHDPQVWLVRTRLTIGEAYREYPKVSQKWVPVKGRRVDWKLLVFQMEQKIIEFENFGKKWFGKQK